MSKLNQKTPSGWESFLAKLLVGVERFELSTSRTRTVRSTGLSHTPICERADYTIQTYFDKAVKDSE